MSLCRRAAEGVSPYGGRVWFALVLQPAVEDIRFVFKAPSTRVPARVAAQRDKVSAMDKEPSTRVPARVAADIQEVAALLGHPSTRVPARVAAAKTRKVRGSCTDYYVHLNLLECITCSAKQSLTVTFSISGREVAPKAVRSCMEICDYSVFAPRSFLMILSIPGMDRFCEALKSAFARKPHFVQQNTTCDGLLSLSILPHLLHRWEV